MKLPVRLAHLLGLPARLVQKFKRKKPVTPNSARQAIATPAPEKTPPAHSPISQVQAMRQEPINSEKAQAAMLAERARCREIVRYGIKHGCPHQAYAFAFETAMTTRQAIQTMRNLKLVAAVGNGQRQTYR